MCHPERTSRLPRNPETFDRLPDLPAEPTFLQHQSDTDSQLNPIWWNIPHGSVGDKEFSCPYKLERYGFLEAWVAEDDHAQEGSMANIYRKFDYGFHHWNYAHPGDLPSYVHGLPMHTYSSGENTSWHWSWDGSSYSAAVQCLLALAGKGPQDSYAQYMFVSRPGDGYDKCNSGLARRWPDQGFERRAYHARLELQRIRHQDGSWSRLEVDQHESVWRFPSWPVCAGEWFQATPKQYHPYETSYISIWARVVPEDLESEGDKFKDCDFCEQMGAYLLAADSPVGYVLTETGCLFYTRYVEQYIPHLLLEPAGVRMDVQYLECLEHPPVYSNLFNDRRVRKHFNIPTHDHCAGAKALNYNLEKP